MLYALDHRVDSSAVGHVGDNREAADLARDLFHLLRRAGADRNASARRGELPGDEGADSAPAAGDEGYLAVQLSFGSHRPRIRGGSPAGDSGVPKGDVPITVDWTDPCGVRWRDRFSFTTRTDATHEQKFVTRTNLLRTSPNPAFTADLPSPFGFR